jgi:hypothetical protein
MSRLLAFLAVPALLAAASVARASPDCDAVVWSETHGHYHCADTVRYEAVRYAPPRTVVVGAPRVHVDLSIGHGHHGWRHHGGHWGWYAPAPVIHVPLHHHRHGHRW